MSHESPEAREALDVIRDVGGDALVRTLLLTFLDHADDQMAAAERAAESGSAGQIAGAAHSIKSSASQLGAHALAAACAHAESAGAADDDLAGAKRGLDEMRTQLAAARLWMVAVAGPSERHQPNVDD